jgi:hypothetical protein
MENTPDPGALLLHHICSERDHGQFLVDEKAA